MWGAAIAERTARRPRPGGVAGAQGGVAWRRRSAKSPAAVDSWVHTLTKMTRPRERGGGHAHG
eukprot:2959111-Pyramimonas_sp.AAC.1